MYLELKYSKKSFWA